MIKIAYLFWTLLIAAVTTGLSYFYIRGGQNQILHGYPFWFYKSTNQFDLNPDYFNILLFSVDLFFWWLIFSILLVIVMNYVFDSN